MCSFPVSLLRGGLNLLILVYISSCVSSSRDLYDKGVAGPPDVFFMGCAKAGTTALHDYLTEAANICGGTMKEYHYWEFHHERNASLKRYISEFKDCKPGQLTMDGSLSNSGKNSVENIMHTFSPQNLRTKKFILILREPIDRMYSWYNSERVKNAEKTRGKCDEIENCDMTKLGENLTYFKSFKDFYNNNENYGVKAGSYLTKLVKLLYDTTVSATAFRNFPLLPRNQIFIINYDTLKINTTDTLKRITKFLGVVPKHYNMPVTNQLTVQFRKYGLDEIPMQCIDYLYYKPKLDEKNEGLVDFINGDPRRPPDEPYFPPFIDKFIVECPNPLLTT